MLHGTNSKFVLFEIWENTSGLDIVGTITTNRWRTGVSLPKQNSHLLKHGAIPHQGTLWGTIPLINGGLRPHPNSKFGLFQTRNNTSNSVFMEHNGYAQTKQIFYY